MDDVAPELWEQIEKRFRASVKEDDEIEQILKKIEKRTATHMESQRYAIRIGKHSAESLQDTLVSEVLPNGKMYYNIAERTIRPAMELDREMILQTSTEIQEILNANAGIGMKAVKPDANDDRIEGIINRTCAEENFDSIKWIIKAPIEAFAQSIVDDFIRQNADFQYKAGLRPKIRRVLSGKGCPVCRILEGTYDYPDDLPEYPKYDVWTRHDNCRCMVTYDPGDGRRQDVYSKKWYDPDGNALEYKEASFSNGVIKNNKADNLRPINLQLFARGKERAEKYEDQWEKASLKETIKKFAPGASGIWNEKKTKIIFISKDGRYEIISDPDGNYFRIKDNNRPGKRDEQKMVLLDGSDAHNITVNGKTRGRSKQEYRRATHFRNTDKEKIQYPL